ncbi:MAG: hypothetical protein NTZ92_02005 [Candidatus Omnitrophica bacterium]|nr:hypothetical protein [Candidatus Omnitrophota bacterium]
MRSIVVSILLLVSLLSASVAYAHPPSDIIITYDAATKTLTAVIKHNVSNPTQHYINKVDIGLNGKEIAELKFKKQDSYFSQTVTYTSPDIKSGDLLSVEAYCSISGKLMKEIKAQ